MKIYQEWASDAQGFIYRDKASEARDNQPNTKGALVGEGKGGVTACRSVVIEHDRPNK